MLIENYEKDLSDLSNELNSIGTSKDLSKEMK